MTEIMEYMPAEVMLEIFSYLYEKELLHRNVSDLLNCELVCRKWREIMKYSLWKRLCKNLVKRHVNISNGYSELSPTCLQHQNEFEENHKMFFFKLVNLEKRWDIIDSNDKQELCSPKVTILDSTIQSDDSSDDDSSSAKKLKLSNKWRKHHNYSGIYDMVYIKDKSLLVASVDGMIQVWDVSDTNENSGYKCINTINATVLDYEENKHKLDMVSCFYVTETGNSLICGTHDSKLKMFDMRTPGGRLIKKYHVTGKSDLCDVTQRISENNGRLKKGHYVSDIRIRKNTLIAVDWYGELHEWKIVHNKNLSQVNEHSEDMVHLRSFSPNFGPLRDEWEDVMKTWWHSVQYTYNKRHSERLLDFSDDVILLTKDKIMCIIPRDCTLFGKSSVWIETNNTILCCKLLLMQKKDDCNCDSCGSCNCNDYDNEVVILCGQQQGYLLRYAFDQNLFKGPTSSGFTYMKPHNPYIVVRYGMPVSSARLSILHTDFYAKSSSGPLASLYVFRSYYRTSITSLTPTYIPTLKMTKGGHDNCLIVVGDKDGELYFLDAWTLKTKFHIGFPHSSFTDYLAEITSESSNESLYRQGVTYKLRGRLPESSEQESIIWAVVSDCSRVFSGDSNGTLVIHDFWNYKESKEN